MFFNIYFNYKLVSLMDFLSWCDVNNLVSVVIFILVIVSSLIWVVYMLPRGREIIKNGVRGNAFGVGVPVGKGGYDGVTGGGSDDNKDKKDKKDEDKKDAEKKENDENNGTSSGDSNGSGENSEGQTGTG